MNHNDYIETAPVDFKNIARTLVCPVAAMENAERKLYAVQFHPEVIHSQQEQQMLSNFVYKVSDGKALCALSGSVDSSVAAVLMPKAIGKQLTCVFVDHGLLRKDEGDEVEAVFGTGGQYDLNFIRVNAQERFYSRLAGVSERKQKENHRRRIYPRF